MSEDALNVVSSKEVVIQQNKNNFAKAMLSHIDKKMTRWTNRQQDYQVEMKWGNMDKETLKKYLLNYGFGRWSKI